MSKLVTIKLNDIQIPFFVRKLINDDHVIQLAELYEAPDKASEIPPITVTSDKYYLVDGRHRKAAMELAMKTEAVVELVPPMSMADLIAAAFNANTGGSLVPTRDDIEHTIELMIDQGLTHREIIEKIKRIPPSVVRKYIAKVRSNIAKRSLRRAVMAVADTEMTVDQAALRYSVSVETLKDELRGTKKKAKGFGMDEIKGGLSSSFKSISQKNAQLLLKLMDNVRDGKLDPQQLQETVRAIGTYIHRMDVKNKEWETRVKALLKGEED